MEASQMVNVYTPMFSMRIFFFVYFQNFILSMPVLLFILSLNGLSVSVDLVFIYINNLFSPLDYLSRVSITRTALIHAFNVNHS